ncbi:MAG: hypothetical protein SGJ27_15715 [Candidatus Melainabacteria bacterium]|nr:hypothetical protein [Candidatus Melainabacteria bacterium]
MVKVFLALLMVLFSATAPAFAQSPDANDEVENSVSTAYEATSESSSSPESSSAGAPSAGSLLPHASSTSTTPSTSTSTSTPTTPDTPVTAAPSTPSILPNTPDLSKTTTEFRDSSTTKAKEYFFLVVEGKGMPVKEILVNGINVLGGSLISLSMPINVTPMIKRGLNQIKVRCVSHNAEGLVTIMEKRTSGPKKLEIVRMALPPNESGGKEIVKDLAFNVDPAPVLPAKINLTESDREKILGLVSSYYSALKTKNPTKLRSLYSSALKEEQRIFPEGADFFTKVLNKEIALLKRKEIQMNSFTVDNIMLEQENDKIKAVRTDRKAMMESNEIEVSLEPFLSEVTPEEALAKNVKAKSKQKKNIKTKKALTATPTTEQEEHEEGDRLESSAKQRLLTTTLLFRKIDGQWHLALPRGV